MMTRLFSFPAMVLLSGIGLCGLTLCGPAQAADLPARTSPVILPPPPIFSWSGLYIGAHAGYGWGHDKIGLPAIGYSTSFSPNGVVGGGQIGYNYQINHFVVGVEADIDGTSLSKTAFDPVTGTAYGSQIPVEGSVRGRLGITWDRALLYATGGLALGQEKATFTPPGASYTRGLTGWTLGGGVEYAMTNNWSMRGEYRFTEFERATDTPPASPTINHRLDEHAVRVGVDYKFEMYAPPPPVIGKY